MRIPKTPVEFDYDLWTTEDGKCMVRVKATGETTEVDREVMKLLRAEEKKLRRSYGDLSPDNKEAESATGTVLSLDALPEDEVKAPAWLADSFCLEESVLSDISVDDFCNSLSPEQSNFFLCCFIRGDSITEYIRTHNVGRTTLWRWQNEIREKAKKFF